MDHLTEESIERYILEPARFSPAELEQLYRHLKQCSRCRYVHDFLKDFYGRLTEAEAAASAVPDVPRKGELLTEPIILRPLKNDSVLPPDVNARITVLAAETSASSPHRFSTKTALVSEKDKLLMRIVHDRLQNRYRLYLIAEDTDRIRNTRVSIPALGVDLKTNEHGVAEFTLAAPGPEPDWQTIQAVVAS